MNKELIRMIRQNLGINDVSKIEPEDYPKIIEHIENMFGTRDLSRALSKVALKNLDSIERSMNPGSAFKIKEEDIPTIIDRIDDMFGTRDFSKIKDEDIPEIIERIKKRENDEVEDSD